MVALSIFGFSAFTWLMGTATSVLGLKFIRLGLGLTEGPCPVGLASTINNWFPPKEKATATGVYIAYHVRADPRAAAGGVDRHDLGLALGLLLLRDPRSGHCRSVVSAGAHQTIRERIRL